MLKLRLTRLRFKSSIERRRNLKILKEWSTTYKNCKINLS